MVENLILEKLPLASKVFKTSYKSLQAIIPLLLLLKELSIFGVQAYLAPFSNQSLL